MMTEMDGNEAESVAPPPRKAERLLIDVWPVAVEGISLRRVLATTLGRAQAATFMAGRYPETTIVCSLLDQFATDVVQSSMVDAPENLELRCEADFSFDRDLDAVAMPTSAQGEAELTRERLQSAYVALRPGGVLLTTTDNPRDTWLAEVVESFGGKVRRIAADDGVAYVVRRCDVPPKRIRNFTCEFAFRDGERLLNVVSRPGVFSHRRVDPGARRILDAMEIHNGDRVLDIGCGWGTVALAAACRQNNTHVVALDSNARAVECTRGNAELNGVADRLTAKLEAYGRTDAPGTFDVALANPPYYAQFAIAERFVAAAEVALRRGGRLWVVAKHAEWYFERLPLSFDAVEAVEDRGYVVLAGRKR